MAKKFKKNQKIIAELPSGKIVEGFYIEPYGSDGHSFYIMEFEGEGRDGEPMYKKKRFGVKDAFIKAAPEKISKPSTMQYKAWLSRAMTLETRISDYERQMGQALKNGDKIDADKHATKLLRTRDKLKEIERKIEEFEMVGYDG